MTTLPTITTAEYLVPTLKIWERRLNAGLAAPPAPRMIVNLQVWGGPIGSIAIGLSWENVTGADGYQVQMSPTGDFSNATIVATISSGAGTSFIDNTGVTGVKHYYRVRATSGTTSQPHATPGPWSASIAQTSGSNNTVYDQTSYSWLRAPKVR